MSSKPARGVYCIAILPQGGNKIQTVFHFLSENMCLENDSKSVSSFLPFHIVEREAAIPRIVDREQRLGVGKPGQIYYPDSI